MAPPRDESDEDARDVAGGHADPQARDEGPRRSDPPKADRAPSEFVRRLLEASLEKFADRPEVLRQKLTELKIPKEVWSSILSQLDDRKSGLYRVIAREIRDFLEGTSFAEDLVRALTTLSFEIRTEVRFVPNDAGSASPRVQSKFRVKTDENEPSSPKPPES